MTIGLFKTIKTTSQTLAKNLTKIDWSIWIEQKKNGMCERWGVKFKCNDKTLKSIVKCEVLNLDESF
jgi:hypothetical protein